MVLLFQAGLLGSCDALNALLCAVDCTAADEALFLEMTVSRRLQVFGAWHATHRRSKVVPFRLVFEGLVSRRPTDLVRLEHPKVMQSGLILALACDRS